MILTGKEILNRIDGDIIIQPFCREQLNPNSYNLRLHNELLVYKNDVLDVREENQTEAIIIPEDGLVMLPGYLYLARTREYTETYGLVPIIQGRSSIGRLGITVHITSGFGDIGFRGYWTLQLSCIKKVRIYADIKICQIYYQTVAGDFDNYDSGKYQGSQDIQASKMHQELLSGVKPV